MLLLAPPRPDALVAKLMEAMARLPHHNPYKQHEQVLTSLHHKLLSCLPEVH